MTLQKVLSKLSNMNARLNIDTLPSSHEFQEQLTMSPSGAVGLRRESANGSQTTRNKKKSNYKASSVGKSIRTTSNKSGLTQPEVQPIMFDGKEINTIHDLIANFKLDTYEEAMKKR